MSEQSINALLTYLPRLERPNKHLVVGYQAATGTGDAVPGPLYAQHVLEFFEAAARWEDPDYDPVEAGRMLEDEFLIEQATLDQVRSMLTYCVRGERYNPGHWHYVLSSGQLTALLRRLAELTRD